MNLGKEFVRAAVRQVGRDAGKIVSNNIFGDAHAIKIKNTTFDQEQMQYINIETRTPIERDEIIKEVEKEGYTIKKTKLTIGDYFGFIAVTFLSIFPLFGLLAPAIALGQVFSNKEIIGFEYASKMVQKMSYVSDRRYKTGMRPNGYVEVEDKIYIPPTEEQQKKFIKKKNIWLALFIFLMIFGTISFVYVMSQAH